MLAAMFPLFALLLATITGELLNIMCNFSAVREHRLHLTCACTLAALLHYLRAPAASPFALDFRPASPTLHTVCTCLRCVLGQCLSSLRERGGVPLLGLVH